MQCAQHMYSLPAALTWYYCVQCVLHTPYTASTLCVPPAAVGSRVKYVMDTPEVIWGCLDAGSHLDAARRLLRVQEVHGHLQEAFAPLVASKFPVLSHQWQTVLKFRCGQGKRWVQHVLSTSQRVTPCALVTPRHQ